MRCDSCVNNVMPYLPKEPNMSTISNKTRADAVTIMLCCASRQANNKELQVIGSFRSAMELGFSSDAHQLAHSAYMNVPEHGGNYEEQCAEAAALLESGWCPGDELELLGNLEAPAQKQEDGYDASTYEDTDDQGALAFDLSDCS